MALGLPASQKTCWSNVRNIPHNDKMHRISVQTLVTQTVWHYSYRSDSDRYEMVPDSFNSIEKSVDGLSPIFSNLRKVCAWMHSFFPLFQKLLRQSHGAGSIVAILE